MRLDKPYTNKQYADLAVFCNENGLIIEDKGDYLESVNPPAPTKEQLAEEKRAIRNKYLTDSDKYMLPDFPVSDEERALWVKYREYLRNITKAPNFPNVDVLNFKNWKEQINDKEVVNEEKSNAKFRQFGKCKCSNWLQRRLLRRKCV